MIIIKLCVLIFINWLSSQTTKEAKRVRPNGEERSHSFIHRTKTKSRKKTTTARGSIGTRFGSAHMTPSHNAPFVHLYLSHSTFLLLTNIHHLLLLLLFSSLTQHMRSILLSWWKCDTLLFLSLIFFWGWFNYN